MSRRAASRRLDVQNEWRPGMARGDVLGQIGGQKIAGHLPAGRVNDADPVAIPVEADPKIGAVTRHFGTKKIKRFGIDGIRMVVWKGAVDLGEQHAVTAVQPVHQGFGHRAAGTIATIPHDGQPGGARAVDPVEIGWLDIQCAHGRLTAAQPRPRLSCQVSGCRHQRRTARP